MSVTQQLITEHIDIWTAADTEKRSGRGRSSSNAGSVYGIKKLRELILELAVRGKLVPQDTNDEPASELLKRIQAQKAKLVAEDKIKQDKPLIPITDDEKPFELPFGWAYSRLGECVEIIRGITFPGSEKTKTPEKGRVACLRTTNVQDQIEWSDLLYIREEFVSREDQILMPRDIVMSMANSRELVGKVALVGAEIHQKTSFGGFLGVLRPYLIEPRFVMALLRTPHTREALIDSASQTTNIANISLAKLRPLFFAIPPLTEQHRIVAKVDELMTLCDLLEAQHRDAAEAHEKLVSHLLDTLTQSQSADDFSARWQRIAAHFDTLFTTEGSIDALKQTLLQLAVMGKLVPQDTNDEPASELLKRIETEKAKLIGEGRVKKEKPLSAIADIEKPFKLPQGWEWVRLGSALDITGGVTLGRKIIGTDLVDLPYLRVANVQRGYLILDSIKTVVIRQSELSRYQPLKDDLLVTEGGDWDKVGRTAIWNTEIENCLHQNHIFRMRKITTELSSSWIEMYMNSIAKAYFQAASKQTTNLASINMTQLKNCLLAVPMLHEQRRIVAKVDQLMVLCEQLIARTSDANLLQRKLAELMVEHATAQ